MISAQNQQPPDARPLGLLAEFRTQEQLMVAAQELRHGGHEQLEAFSPFPIHGLDGVLGVRPTRLPWLVLAAGVIGGVAALAFQWWTNAIDYPFLISGKPLFSLPANIPVTFEVVILAAAFATFGGMLVLNGLPRLSNPLFRNARFRAATDNRFFLLIDATDQRFDRETTAALLRRVHAVSIEDIAPEPGDSQRLPRVLVMTAYIVAALALIPPVMIAAARSTTSDKPRLHNFFDMDFQPKFKPQRTTTLFADGRVMRPRVRGTVSRGQLQDDPRFYQGLQPIDKSPGSPTQSASHDSGESVDQPNWVTEIPLPVTGALMERGRQRFNIHCAVCHGRVGQGNGLATIRALELEQGTWVPPTSIHADHVRQQPVGELFNTITNGVRKMPAYGHQIPPEDRWAIVLYLRALQRSQNASIDDVPEDIRSTLRELN